MTAENNPAPTKKKSHGNLGRKRPGVSEKLKGNKNALGNNGGRPMIWDGAFFDQEAKLLNEWLNDFFENDKKIYLMDYLRDRPYPETKLSEFKERSMEFRLAIERAKLFQEKKFMLNGLNKEWDPGFAQFCMARICADKWKKSWDQPTAESLQAGDINITIRKVTRDEE